MLPVELCNLIIDYLHDSKSSLLACSLVSRTWVAECRFHLFSKVLLDCDTADPFFQLTKNPHTTITLAHTRELRVAGTNHREDQNLDDRLLENLGILSRCRGEVFERVKTLCVVWVGWWTSSEAEILSTGLSFKNVTKLVLWHNYFQVGEEFQALVASFPALEILSLQSIHFRVSDLREDHWHAAHPLPANLHTISLYEIPDPRFICSLVPCPSLRVFKCQCIDLDDYKPAWAKELNRLLLSAAERLEEFEFIIYGEEELDDGIDLDSRAKLIDVAQNPSLKRIRFSIEGVGSYLIPFLGHLSKSGSSTPRLETLDIVYLSEYDLDWERLDDILQQPYFHALRELKTIFEVSYTLLDVVGQTSEKPAWYLKPNEGSGAHIKMERDIAKFRDRLSKCQARGILRVEKVYQFRDLRG